MKFFAINGSPRKVFNTAQLLDKSLEGIKSVLPEAEVERIDLYDIPFNGCKSCFACKKINGRHYGRCVYKDDFKPILNEITQADLMAVNKMYKTIFDEINSIGKDTGIVPQIIVVDHVDGNNLECKEEFEEYVRCNWRNGQALI